MQNAVFVFLGGGVGSVLRYFTILGVGRFSGGSPFPLGVFVANVIGAFVLGLLMGIAPEKLRSTPAWLFTTTGLLGGFTTFSTLSSDTWLLFSGDRALLALINAVGSLLLGITAAAIGWQVGRTLSH